MYIHTLYILIIYSYFINYACTTCTHIIFIPYSYTYTPKYKPAVTFISRNMIIISNKLLDHDTIDDVRNTPQQEPPKLFPPPNYN